MAESKHLNTVEPGHIVQDRPGIPSDYHCTCEYCQKFMGEIYNTEHDKYYSNRIRKGYYVDKAGDHLDVGHVIGYKWAIQNLCPPGGYVLDPTAGTGTAVVEAITSGRNGIGIELEYPEVGERNIREQWAKARVPDPEISSYFRQGDATKLDKYFAEWSFSNPVFKGPFLDLIVNGTPYPKLSGKSSDAPERKNLHTKVDTSFDYMHEDNIGLTKGDAYWKLVETIYSKSIAYLKPGGYFVIIIKDLVQNKKPYLLHKYITDVVLASNPDMEYHGFFLHKHCPTTMFINTYQKRFPGLPIPLYQTGIVLRKKGNYPHTDGFPVEESKTIRQIPTPEEIATDKIKKDVEKIVDKKAKIALDLSQFKSAGMGPEYEGPKKKNKKNFMEEYDRGFQDGYTSACSDIKEQIWQLNKDNGNREEI